MAILLLLFVSLAVLNPAEHHGALAEIPPIRSLGYTEMPWVAFAQVLHNEVTGHEDLVVSSFNAIPGTMDDVYVVRDIEKQVTLNGGNDLPREILTNELPWPNEVEEIPEDVFGREDLWWCASGFLVPTKGDGNVAILEVSDIVPSTVHDISTQRGFGLQKWWYHRVAWHDMDNDGLKDALSSRAYLDSDGNAVTEMVWFKHPRLNDPLTSIWDEFVLFPGPDALWRFEQMTVLGQTYDVIISTQYFAEKLVVSWIESDGSWTDPSTIQHRVIDDIVEERYFDCQLTDLNADGKRDLLVSINSDKNGKLAIYEIPSDFRFEEWTRHTIAEGFKPQGRIVLEGNGAPGTSLAFYPMDPAYDGRLKPLILLTGDDDGNVYIFESDDDMDPQTWTYTYQSFFYAKGTVGAPAVKDVDGDGFMEIFVPAYSAGQLHVYTFKP